MEINWFLPTNGDGEHLGSNGLPRTGIATQADRAPTLDYLRQIVRACEQARFHAIMVPMAHGFEDPWLVTAALAQAAQRLKFLITVRPGLEAPEHTVRKAACLQRFCAQRLLLHIVSGSIPQEQRALGDFLAHDARYARTAGFLETLRQTWPDEAALQAPPIYFGGASSVAEQVAASHAQTYVMWGEPPGMIHERIERMRALAAQQGRSLRFGLRLHVFAAATSDAAWARVQRLVQAIPRQTIENAQQQLSAYESVGQARQRQLRHAPQARHGGHDLEISPNLWAGVGLVRGGAGTALVGSYAEVAQRLHEYARLGVESFTLSGYPHLEEAIHLGEHLLPLLPQAPMIPV